MPKALVEIRCRYEPSVEIALMTMVHAALVQAFKIPPTDETVRLLVHEPHRFSCSPLLSHPDRYTLVTIDCFAGRSVDAKRRLYGLIVSGMQEFGIPIDHVTVVLRESSTENWGIDGGQVASEVDLGFNLEV